MDLQDPYEKMKFDVYREVLRQTRHTFNCRLYIVRASILVILIGCGLPFIGYPTEGVLMAIAGGGTTGFCNQLGQDSQRKLEKLVGAVKDFSPPTPED